MTGTTARRRALLVALLQTGLLISLGGVYVVERIQMPRGWSQVVPIDPSLPIRGRYVSLRLLVPAAARPANQPALRPWINPQNVLLTVEAGRLAASTALPNAAWPAPGRVVPAQIEVMNGMVVARLSEPLAFFIPPDVPDPSRRAAGEELWVEVSLPAEGPPRPIRLGVRRPSTPGDTTATIRPLPIRP